MRSGWIEPERNFRSQVPSSVMPGLGGGGGAAALRGAGPFGFEGGAIKGANRFDTFWGAGVEATQVAGGMSANGVALILVPKGTASVARAQP